MHYLVGLGILAGLAWFAFGAGAARILVGAALLGVVAVVGLLVVIAGIDIHRQSVEQTEWENGGRERHMAEIRQKCAPWVSSSANAPIECTATLVDLRRERAEAEARK